MNDQPPQVSGEATNLLLLLAVGAVAYFAFNKKTKGSSANKNAGGKPSLRDREQAYYKMVELMKKSAGRPRTESERQEQLRLMRSGLNAEDLGRALRGAKFKPSARGKR